MLSKYEIQNLRKAVNAGRIEEYLNEAEALADEQFICSIVWTTPDIEQIRPEWSSDKVQDAAGYVAEHLQDRSTEEGWQILEHLLSFYEGDC